MYGMKYYIVRDEFHSYAKGKSNVNGRTFRDRGDEAGRPPKLYTLGCAKTLRTNKAKEGIKLTITQVELKFISEID